MTLSKYWGDNPPLNYLGDDPPVLLSFRLCIWPVTTSVHGRYFAKKCAENKINELDTVTVDFFITEQNVALQYMYLAYNLCFVATCRASHLL